MSSIKIGIAEDQQIFRKGLVVFLNSIKNIEVIYEAPTGIELLEKILEIQPEIIILNHNIPKVDGIEITKIFRLKYPDLKILILSSQINDKNILHAIENGANGFISKDDNKQEIERAIRGVLENDYYINDRVSNILINNMINNGKTQAALPADIQFTNDELKILAMISKEYTTQQIADTIHKSTRTVEKYRTKMLVKVGAQNTVGLIIYAIKNKIIEI